MSQKALETSMYLPENCGDIYPCSTSNLISHVHMRHKCVDVSRRTLQKNKIYWNYKILSYKCRELLMELLFAASEMYGWFTGHFQLQFAWWTGNLFRGIDHCLSAALNAVRLIWTTNFSDNFSLVQVIQTMLAMYDFSRKKLIFGKNSIHKESNSESFCFLIKSFTVNIHRKPIVRSGNTLVNTL